MVVLTVLVGMTSVAPATPPPAPVEQAAPPQSSPSLSAPTSVDELIVTAPAQAPSPKLNLDVTGDFARKDIPYLRQRPTDGCKPMAGGSVAPSGRHGAAAGLVCAKTF